MVSQQRPPVRKRRPNYFVAVAVILGIGLAVVTASRPWKVYQDEKAKADGMRSELQTLQKSQVEHQETDQMMNPVQKEEEARRLGYVKPNEKPLDPQKPVDSNEVPKD